MASILPRLYDPLTVGLEVALLGRLRRELFGDLGGRVLDLGAGTGRNLPHLRAGSVVALDPDGAMLRRAAGKASGRQYLVQGDASRLPFAEGTFDAVTVALALCTIPDLEGALREARRVLRAGGRLAFLEHVRLPGPAGRLQRLLTPLWSRLAGGCRLDRETLHLIVGAGFRPLRLVGRLGGLLVGGVALVERAPTGTMADDPS